MSRSRTAAVLTLRVTNDLQRRIERAARRSRKTRSEVVREVLEQAFGVETEDDPAVAARQQSLLVSGRASEREALQFVEESADLKGWQ